MLETQHQRQAALLQERKHQSRRWKLLRKEARQHQCHAFWQVRAALQGGCKPFHDNVGA